MPDYEARGSHWQTTPAIVLGVESQIGLAIVRELGRAGVPVIAMSHDRKAIGLASRYVSRAVVAGPPRSASVLQAMNQLATELGPVSLLTVSEGNLMWLNGERHRLSPDVRLAVPPKSTLEAVLNKSRTLSAARALGISVPLTEQPRSMGDIARLAREFPFPAVLKWADGNAVSGRIAAAGLEFCKAEYVYSGDELLRIGERYSPLGEWPLVQQYCPGHGLGQFFFMHEGKAVRRFQHRRVAEWPPEGGFSSVCDGVPLLLHAALQEQSVALLNALGWSGVAMVEYRYDTANDKAVLMEINGRFWGSLPLAVAAGAGFALLSHAAALGGELPQLPSPVSDLRCRMVATEVKRLLRLWLQPGKIVDRTFVRQPVLDTWRFFADFFRPRVHYFVWSGDDPKPLWRDLKNLLA